MLINKTEFMALEKHGSWDFLRIANSFLSKVKYAILPLFKGPEVLSSASNETKLLAKNFSKSSNLDDTGVALPVFPLELI